MKKIVALMLAVLIICMSSMAFAASESKSTSAVADILFLKPLGAAATAFGSVVFVISLPFAAMSDSTSETFETLVKDPYEYTFKRPVGENTGL